MCSRVCSADTVLQCAMRSSMQPTYDARMRASSGRNACCVSSRACASVLNRNVQPSRLFDYRTSRAAGAVARASPMAGTSTANINEQLKKAAEARMEEAVARIESEKSAGKFDALSESDQVRQSIRATLKQLTHGLVERDTEARLMLLAAMSGEHVLFLGPPGTAKSELSRRLHTCLSGTVYFERLLTRFSVPEELFGPLSMRALEQDMYLRDTEGYLPSAEVAFIDEVFKANSAILNTLLTILNERLFDNGKQRLPVPLLCLVAASNELPESEELDALYDRFLLRTTVKQVSPGALSTLLKSVSVTGPVATPQMPSGSAASDATPAADGAAPTLTVEEARTVRDKALAAVSVPQNVVDLLVDLRSFMQEKLEPPAYVSDRRLVKAVAVMQVAAYTDGRSTVHPVDTLLLRHMIWSRPEDADRVQDFLLKRLVMDTGDDTSVNYVLSSLFARTCHSLQDTAKLDLITEELANLREAVEESLRTASNPSEFSMGGGEGAGGVLNSLWISAEDSEAVEEVLMPRLKKSKEGLMTTLFEVIVLELAIERGADAVVLAEIMPRYWADFIRNATVEEAKSMGGTRKSKP